MYTNYLFLCVTTLPHCSCLLFWFLGDILLFNIQEDPSEAYPLILPEVASEIFVRFQKELKTFVYGGKLIPPPDLPGEGPDKYGVCCDRKLGCDCNGKLPDPPEKINL